MAPRGAGEMLERTMNRDAEGAVMSTETMRELDSRCSDGIHVRLIWRPVERHVVAAVADAKTGDAFVVDVRESDAAADVFHHPYGYAAWRNLDTRPAAASPGAAVAV
jgi:hypothetical protein